MPASTGALSGHSLLAVFAHPDDESLACGGLLAWCAELGARVTLLCVTQGEDATTSDGDREALRTRRAGELGLAAQALGLSEVILRSYPDGELPWLDTTRIAELQADIESAIRHSGADVVVTFGEDGLYWHPDHIALHEHTTAVVERLGTRGPALYYVTMPEGAVRELVDTVARQSPGAGRQTVFGIDDPDAFGTLAEPPTLVLDVSRFAGRKLAAMKAHASQAGDGAIAYLRDEDAPRLLGTEQLRRATIGAPGPSFLDRLPSHR